MLPRLQAIRSSKTRLELQPGLSHVGWKILVTGLAFEAPHSRRVSSPHGEGLTLRWNVLLPPSVRRGEEGRARGRVGLSAPTSLAAPGKVAPAWTAQMRGCYDSEKALSPGKEMLSVQRSQGAAEKCLTYVCCGRCLFPGDVTGPRGGNLVLSFSSVQQPF